MRKQKSYYEWLYENSKFIMTVFGFSGGQLVEYLQGGDVYLPLVYYELDTCDEFRNLSTEDKRKYLQQKISKLEAIYKNGWKSIRGEYYPKKKTSYGYIDINDNFIIDPQFDAAADFHEGLACVGLNGKYGFVDKIGEYVVQPKFDHTADFHSGVARIKLDGKYGFIDSSGQYIIKPQFDYTRKLSNEIIAVNKDDLWGLSNQYLRHIK